MVKSGTAKKIAGTDNTADLGTKPLTWGNIRRLCFDMISKEYIKEVIHTDAKAKVRFFQLQTDSR